MGVFNAVHAALLRPFNFRLESMNVDVGAPFSMSRQAAQASSEFRGSMA
jgi:hypothetical protein